MKIEFIKCHGSGNDFVLIDGIGKREYLHADIPCNVIAELDDNSLKLFAKLICDRKGPVGADGVLLLLPSAVADARMRMFNPDGSEAEMCGNGIRCAARLAIEITGRRSVNHPTADSDSGECSVSKDNDACHNSRRDNDARHDTKRDSVRIETAKAVLECRREEDIYSGVESYSVLINNVSLISDSFACAEQKPFIDSPITALSETESFTFVSLGNPHIVSYRGNAGQSDNSGHCTISNDAKEAGETELMQVGLKANAMPSLFPEGVNVTFYDSKGMQAIYTETFERGAGLTQACGTAMSACSIAACISGLCRYGEWIDVYNKGGMVKCLVESSGNKTTEEPASNLLIKASYELSTKVGNTLSKISVRLLGNATFEYSAAVDFDNHIAENSGTNLVISVTSETTIAGLDANHAEPEATISIPQRINSALSETYLIKSKANPDKTKKNSVPQLGQVYEKTTHFEEITAYNQFLKSVSS